MRTILAAALITLLGAGCKQVPDRQETAGLQTNIIFPYQQEHVHGSTVAELPNGDLLCVFRRNNPDKSSGQLDLF
jgi:hypothetical protein